MTLKGHVIELVKVEPEASSPVGGAQQLLYVWRYAKSALKEIFHSC